MQTIAITQTKESSLLTARLTPRRLTMILIVLAVAFVLAVMIAIAVGSESIGVTTILKILAAKITGVPADVPQEHQTIITEIRLPRVWAAIIVGAALAVAGAAYQALLRNPLADPYVLGVSTGAAVGAISAILFVSWLPLSKPLAAFLGAVLAIVAVYFLGQSRERGSTERLVLAGVIVNTFLSSVVIYLVTSAAGSRLQSVFSWLIGDLNADTGLLPLVTVFIALGIAIIFANARSLNLIMVGEEDALALGVSVERVKLMVYLASSLITGAAVAISGVIGFVGLVIPHAIRLAGGSDNRLVIPGAILVGSTFLLITDTVARTIAAPRELHIGVLTALIGAPVFIYLLRRTS